MIGKPEIIQIAGQFGLNPHVVEKDYALGWLLAGIFAHGRIADSWVFKGGTCLKKCFFETYRFSEDLDFTLKDASQLNEVFLKEVFAEIGEWVYEHSGLEMPEDRQDFDVYDNPRGNKSCQGKISYRGPVSPTSGGWPRIKLDLTADERIYPLIEDNSVRSGGSTMLNLLAGWQFGDWRLQGEVLNLLDSDDHDVDYFYASRLPGEPAEGVEDIHYHIFEPRQVRLQLSWRV